MLTQSFAGEASAQSRTWSSAAFAADAADDEPRASMIAAPRCCTVGMKSFSTHCWSTRSPAFFPSTLVWKMSGYWVAEWLPQIVMLVTDVTCTAVFAATCAHARLWSSRVIAVNRSRAIDGALFIAMRQFVLAG